MTATRTSDLRDNRRNDSTSKNAQDVRLTREFDVISTQEMPIEAFIVAVSAIAVVCALAATLGWQIALFLVAGLIVKTISERKETGLKA